MGEHRTKYNSVRVCTVFNCSGQSQILAFLKSLMYIFMKMSPILHMYCSQSLKNYSDRLGAESNLQSESEFPDSPNRRKQSFEAILLNPSCLKETSNICATRSMCRLECHFAYFSLGTYMPQHRPTKNDKN